jgi:hypothetical protein
MTTTTRKPVRKLKGSVSARVVPELEKAMFDVLDKLPPGTGVTDLVRQALEREVARLSGVTPRKDPTLAQLASQIHQDQDHVVQELARVEAQAQVTSREVRAMAQVLQRVVLAHERLAKALLIAEAA